MTEQIQQIPLSEIYPSEGNRKYGGFDPVKLEELAESIRSAGVLQPALVRARHDNHRQYELVVGERRWRAAKMAGLEALPCVIRDLDDVTVLRIQTIENLQREDIHPLDEADGYARLIERAGYDVEHLAQEVGRSPSYVYQRLKLRDLIEPARKMLIDGKVTAGHAILIARLPAGQQKELVGSWLFRRDEDVSVRGLDHWIHNHILLDLNKAAFKKDDPDLDPQAGPCTTCPRRTGFQPALFADVCNGGKRDFCTDPPCFHGKLAALVQRRKYELEESGEPHLQVIDGYGVDYREKQRLEKEGVKDVYGWEECKKKDDGAVRCLVVAGKSPGRLTWGRERNQGRYGRYQPTAAEKKVREERIFDGKVKATMRRRLWDAVIETLEVNEVYSRELSIDLLRLVARNLWLRTFDNLQALYCKTMSWEPPPKKPGEYGHPWQKMGESRIPTMELPDLYRFLLTVSLVSDLDGASYYEPECAKLKAVAALYEVDVRRLETQVNTELQEKRVRAQQRAAKKKAKAKKAEASEG